MSAFREVPLKEGTRVRVKEGSKLTETGVIYGISKHGLFDSYIVKVDFLVPDYFYSCVAILEGALEVIEDTASNINEGFKPEHLISFVAVNPSGKSALELKALNKSTKGDN